MGPHNGCLSALVLLSLSPLFSGIVSTTVTGTVTPSDLVAATLPSPMTIGYPPEPPPGRLPYPSVILVTAGRISDLSTSIPTFLIATSFPRASWIPYAADPGESRCRWRGGATSSDGSSQIRCTFALNLALIGWGTETNMYIRGLQVGICSLPVVVSCRSQSSASEPISSPLPPSSLEERDSVALNCLPSTRRFMQ